MTAAGAVLLLVAAALMALWILDLVRRGRLYVGYGIVLLTLLALVVGAVEFSFRVIPDYQDIASGS